MIDGAMIFIRSYHDVEAQKLKKIKQKQKIHTYSLILGRRETFLPKKSFSAAKKKPS